MLEITTAGQRAQMQPAVNIALFGPTGIGKTFQAKSLDPEKTLFMDLEAGALAIQDWPGDIINMREQADKLGVHPWELTRAITCILCGPDLTDAKGPYGRAAYDQYVSTLGDRSMFDKYDTIFVDSITVASRWSFDYTRQHDPEAFSDKTGKPDTRGAYGAHGRGVVTWLTHLQQQSKRMDGSGKSVVVVGIMDERKDDIGRITYEPQIVGSMAGRELPGIFDEVISMIAMPDQDQNMHRTMVCHKMNQLGLPAKDRSGRLEMYEPANLAEIMAKIQTQPRQDTDFDQSMPAAPDQSGQEMAAAAFQPAPASPQPEHHQAAQPHVGTGQNTPEAHG
jgi:hypothetical protein